MPADIRAAGAKELPNPSIEPAHVSHLDVVAGWSLEAARSERSCPGLMEKTPWKRLHLIVRSLSVPWRMP